LLRRLSMRHQKKEVHHTAVVMNVGKHTVPPYASQRLGWKFIKQQVKFITENNFQRTPSQIYHLNLWSPLSRTLAAATLPSSSMRTAAPAPAPIAATQPLLLLLLAPLLLLPSLAAVRRLSSSTRAAARAVGKSSSTSAWAATTSLLVGYREVLKPKLKRSPAWSRPSTVACVECAHPQVYT